MLETNAGRTVTTLLIVINGGFAAARFHFVSEYLVMALLFPFVMIAGIAVLTAGEERSSVKPSSKWNWALSSTVCSLFINLCFWHADNRLFNLCVVFLGLIGLIFLVASKRDFKLDGTTS